MTLTHMRLSRIPWKGNHTKCGLKLFDSNYVVKEWYSVCCRNCLRLRKNFVFGGSQ